MIYSKTLNTNDFNLITEHEHIKNIIGLLKGATYRFEHPMRAWEYGLALNSLRSNKTKTVLDVGGGGSVFAPSAAYLGMDVTQVDPGDVSGWIEQQNVFLSTKLKFIQRDFFSYKENEEYDAVVCLSVIEHVLDDIRFFNGLLDYVKVGGILFLTTDFHESGISQSSGHIRTYNESGMINFIQIAKKKGFAIYGDKFNYKTYSENVYNYTFASLALERINYEGNTVHTNTKQV
jgi:SAM-dependent methyltransferase